MENNVIKLVKGGLVSCIAIFIFEVVCLILQVVSLTLWTVERAELVHEL